MHLTPSPQLTTAVVVHQRLFDVLQPSAPATVFLSVSVKWSSWKGIGLELAAADEVIVGAAIARGRGRIRRRRRWWCWRVVDERRVRMVGVRRVRMKGVWKVAVRSILHEGFAELSARAAQRRRNNISRGDETLLFLGQTLVTALVENRGSGRRK